LKQALVILLSLSLYAPHIAKLMAYADCSIRVLTNSDPRFCDCNRIMDDDAVPVAPDRPDKQKDISLKADWKYTCTDAYRFQNAPLVFSSVKNNAMLFFHASLFTKGIFHPPKC